MTNTKLDRLIANNLKNKVTEPIYADNEMILYALRNMLDRGEIGIEDYANSLRRARQFQSTTKTDSHRVTKVSKPTGTYLSPLFLGPYGNDAHYRDNTYSSKSSENNTSLSQRAESLKPKLSGSLCLNPQEVPVSKTLENHPLLNDKLLGVSLFNELGVDYAG